MVMVIYSALVRSHQSTYEGSFGPPCRFSCGRMPGGRASNCREGLTRPTSPHERNAHFVVPRARGGSRCCIIWEATAGRWGGGGCEALQ